MLSVFRRAVLCRTQVDYLSLHAAHHFADPVSYKISALTSAGVNFSSISSLWKKKNPTCVYSQKSYLSSTNAYSTREYHAQVSKAFMENSRVKITLAPDQELSYPSAWLRENCQCSACFNATSLQRAFILDKPTEQSKMKSVKVTDSGALEVIWSDRHQSVYDASWLKEKAFTDDARKRYKNLMRIEPIPWSREHVIAKYSYDALMRDDEILLRWLMELESSGATLIQDLPDYPMASQNVLHRVFRSKVTHYGEVSHVIVRPDANNLAFTDKTLFLHNDLPFYIDLNVLICLHMVKQHTSEGGDTVISDGLMAAQHLQRDHPCHYELLTQTDVYFCDMGSPTHATEKQNFHKIAKYPVIQLNNTGEVMCIRFNNHVRDSFTDIPDEKIDSYYKALSTYLNLMYKHSITFKMENGEMLVLDNNRCQHGRTALQGPGDSTRHLVTSYLAWDEVLCKRRRLQNRFI
ncbi:TauD/TfdA-like domain [Trinorchestia longiramus]|nr:TauD/TfdA-like domain [Trinorchestia longiramus]